MARRPSRLPEDLPAIPPLRRGAQPRAAAPARSLASGRPSCKEHPGSASTAFLSAIRDTAPQDRHELRPVPNGDGVLGSNFHRGVNEFADWLASFRVTDYVLLAFVRGWGCSYRSDRFPALADPDPNSHHEFYPHQIERMHGWDVKVWASERVAALRKSKGADSRGL